MSNAKQRRTLLCAFCDDVRYEIGNKMSLMGIYGPELYVMGTAPTVLPKLVVVLEAITDFEDSFREIGLRIKMRGAEHDMLSVTIPTPEMPPKAEDTSRVILRAAIPVSPFVVAEEGILEVYADIDDESVRAGRLGIHLVPPPSPSNEHSGGPAVTR